MNKSAPRVVIDARMVTPHPHGIGRYVKNLAEGLNEISTRSALRYEPVFLVDRRFPGILPQRLKTIGLDSAFLKPVELLEIPRILKEQGADLYHSPSFSSLAYAPCPWMVTIHDLNHLQFGDWRKKLYYRFLLKRFAKDARALMTVSEFAKEELRRWLDCPADRIEVVYNALDSDFSKELRPLPTDRFPELAKDKGWKSLRAGKYLVCLSNGKPHKNLKFLAEAYLAAQRKNSGALPLLVFSVDEKELPGLKSESLLFVSKLGEFEAKMILENARAAFFPAIYEGFGLPPLESLARGTPIFVSDIPPHREGLQDYSGEWIKWLDPRDQSQWVDAFSSLSPQASDGPLQTPIEMRVSQKYLGERKRSLERFSVQRLAEHMDRIYVRVLGNKS